MCIFVLQDIVYIYYILYIYTPVVKKPLKCTYSFVNVKSYRFLIKIFLTKYYHKMCLTTHMWRRLDYI